jgi:site-specific recombinase XerD
MPRADSLLPRHLLRTTANRREHAIVRALHRWLERQHLTIADLTPERLHQFLARPRRARVSRKASTKYKGWLRGYLQWLHDRGLIGFAPGPPHRPALVELPPLACVFLASLAPTLRRPTCAGYASSLRKLHAWVDARGLTLERLTRSDVEPWLQALHAMGLQPSTRRDILLQTRTYLRWLSEHRRMRSAPDDLIRRTDFPKLPQYLPRPLTAEADRELQRRLGQSQAPGAWALLLMRRTGLRIGELCGLEYHCVRGDRDRPLLKIPLGKLNTERLVPIDADSVELIRRLQQLAPRPRPWLVPGFDGARMSYFRLWTTLDAHSRDLPDPARITSHRLRHTYATEMLSAGMSLLGVMRLLGHRDYRMTLRYTAITPETVGDEYAKALARLATKYHLPARPPAPESPPDPDDLLDQLSRWLRKHISSRQPLRALLKRIERLRREVRSSKSSTKRRKKRSR